MIEEHWSKTSNGHMDVGERMVQTIRMWSPNSNRKRGFAVITVLL